MKLDDEALTVRGELRPIGRTDDPGANGRETARRVAQGEPAGASEKPERQTLREPVRENSEINFALANLHLAQGDRSGAKKFYVATLYLDSRHEGALNNLGVLALQEQKWEPAIKLFSSVLALAPEDAKGHYLLAQAMLGNGNRDGALDEVELALRLEPNQQEFLELPERILRR